MLSLIDTKGKDSEELGRMTSYGVIKGAGLYFGGYCEPDDRSVIDYGYCFHEALLELTALGLGTCWLGGTFGRGFIAGALSMPEGMVIPAISPVGISLEKRVITDRLLRFIAKSAKRKPHEELFFGYSETDGTSKLDLNDELPALGTVLEAVRSAPSASNKQPWRIIYYNDMIHLYWDFDKRYNGSFKSFNIQALDMGIALCHIQKAAEELNIVGEFSFTDPLLNAVPWKYVASRIVGGQKQ